MKRFVILLVDDEERILNFLKTKLKLLSYEVILAGNGIKALEQVQGQMPDLVVLDVTGLPPSNEASYNIVKRGTKNAEERVYTGTNYQQTQGS